MSDLGDHFQAMKDHGKERKRYNLERSLGLLRANKVEFTKLTDHHYRIGVYDFWPSTGVYLNRETKKKGRGVFNLIKKVEGL